MAPLQLNHEDDNVVWKESISSIPSGWMTKSDIHSDAVHSSSEAEKQVEGVFASYHAWGKRLLSILLLWQDSTAIDWLAIWLQKRHETIKPHSSGQTGCEPLIKLMLISARTHQIKARNKRIGEWEVSAGSYVTGYQWKSLWEREYRETASY